MKMLIVTVLAICSLATLSSGLKCDAPKATVPDVWRDMGDKCIVAVREQIQKEINASTVYMAMGAYFARDTVNRPGFSKLFFGSAAEERDHAQQLIAHLLTRGELLEKMASLITVPRVNQSEWNSGVAALTNALELEAEVTKSIKGVIEICDGEDKRNKLPIKEYYLVDYLSGDFLDEQYVGQRKLAGQISTLSKMEQSSPIGEFLFDKELLK
jgi:ferritin heavy chain